MSNWVNGSAPWVPANPCKSRQCGPFYAHNELEGAATALVHVSLFFFQLRRGESMRARIISALCGGIAIFAVCIAGFLTGCARSHKEFAYLVGIGFNSVIVSRLQKNGALTPL